ncbi:thioredoxin [Candidatus Pacearchaeota archaeon]|nr:thioredoxin [Candidatus Pacearchaeota archaeon]
MANKDKVPELSGKEFTSFIKEGISLIDFYADWCMPCIMMEPIIDELSEKFKAKIKFAKINIEDHGELAQKFNIVSIPNFILFKNGEKVEQFIGSSSEEDFEKKLKKFV